MALGAEPRLYGIGGQRSDDEQAGIVPGLERLQKLVELAGADVATDILLPPRTRQATLPVLVPGARPQRRLAFFGRQQGTDAYDTVRALRSSQMLRFAT